MRTLVFIILLVFSSGWAGAHESGSKPSSQGREIETVEEVEVVEVEDAERSGPGRVLGISRHRWMTTTGPIVWLAMAVAVATRHLRMRGRARQLSAVHRFCGYTAFGVGTLHGLVGLFF